LIALPLLIAPAFAFAQGAAKPNAPNASKDAQKGVAQAKDPPKDSEDDLRRAIESSGGSETQVIENLEGYLKKYPKSERHGEIERELYKLSMKLRDRNRAIIYAEKLVIGDEENIDALTNLITMLRERKAEADSNKALAYADELVKRFERIISTSPKPARVSSAQWQDRKDRGIASVYLLRGRAHADLGADDKARADLTKSYQAARLADTAVALAELAEKRKRILQVGHIFRFDPASEWLREAIQAGQFGRLQILRSNFSGFKRPRNDSGVMLADAIHFVDLFNYFIGKTPARVLAATHDFMQRGMEDASLLSLEYQNDAGTIWATIETNYFLPGKFREVTVIGSDLSAVCDYNLAQYKIKTFANRHGKEGKEFKAVEGALHQVESPPEEPLLAELRSFVDSVQTRKPVRADGWAGYDSIRVLEAAFESARSGHTVEVK